MESQLRDAYKVFRAASETQLTLSSAAEWLLDNFYVVQRGLRQIREDMPRAFYHQLPKREGRPRILDLTREMVRGTEGPLDLDWIRRCVDQHQRRSPLTMGELWALPAMLRLSVLERLTEAATRLTSPQVDGVPRDEPPMPDDAAVANAILCLRMLATRDWKAFFESVSEVEEVLRRDPAGTYGDMDFETRDQYRKVVEALATATGRAEPEVARAAVGLAQDAPANGDGSARRTHVGCYLVDRGRSQLGSAIAPPGRCAGGGGSHDAPSCCISAASPC